jgi:hypothetical protein
MSAASVPLRATDAWPPLPLAEWQATYETLHRWLQIVGKTRLALAPMQNHWWNVALYVTARGLGTSTIPYRDLDFDIEFDFLSHTLVVRTSEGAVQTLPLVPRSVAEFYAEYRSLLSSVGVEARIWPVPVEMAGAPTRFTADDSHAAYDPDAAQRCWRILAQTDRVLKEFRKRFVGKCSPSHFWWGGFDIACTRFSGRSAPAHPGGIPNVADYVTREAYSHECISAGWWPGTPDAPVAEPAFYAYAYPEPPGCPEASIGPSGAHYHAGMREWILPYRVVREASDPDASLLEFLESTYVAAAELAGWDRAVLERP